MSAECVVCGPVALLKVGVLGESLGAVLPAADASEFKGNWAVLMVLSVVGGCDS